MFGSALALAIVALIAGYIAYARGLMGGGDAKLLAACIAWAGPTHALEFLGVTGIAGGVLALVLVLPFTARAAAVVQRGWPTTGASPGRVLRAPMPYGVAIAAGGLTVAAQLLAS
jgi:prepilin peptidase CpaA